MKVTVDVTGSAALVLIGVTIIIEMTSMTAIPIFPIDLRVSAERLGGFVAFFSALLLRLDGKKVGNKKNKAFKLRSPKARQFLSASRLLDCHRRPDRDPPIAKSHRFECQKRVPLLCLFQTIELSTSHLQ